MEHIKLPQNEKVNIQAFANMLDLKNLKNSYKLYWFYAIFEEIKHGNKEMIFKKLVYRMIAKSWYSLIEFKLNLGVNDQLNKTVIHLQEKYNFEKNINEEKLIEKLGEIKDKELDSLITEFFKYVPYRLLSPFYKELIGLKDSEKNKIIVELSNIGNNGIYKIIESEKRLEINENWYSYIFENQAIIEGWLINKLIFFLQTRNPNVPAIPFKIFATKERNLNNAKKYWKKIIELNDIKDIYTGKRLTIEESISIDHFIPWSFVLHDELWNLIPTIQSINSSKNDRLPLLDKFLESYCDLQYLGLKTALKHNFCQKELEDYFTISRNIDLKKEISKEYFVKNLKDTINPIYQIAQNQGFIIWEGSFIKDLK